MSKVRDNGTNLLLFAIVEVMLIRDLGPAGYCRSAAKSANLDQVHIKSAYLFRGVRIRTDTVDAQKVTGKHIAI